MKKILCLLLSMLILTLCGCSESGVSPISETDADPRLTATPEELVDLYFEYLEVGNADGIASLNSEKLNRELYPNSDDYAAAVATHDAIFVTYKGYELEFFEISNSSFTYETHPENNQGAAMWGYDNANGYGEIDCEAHFVHPVDGDKDVVPFNFIFVQINGVWYFAS